MSENYFYSSLTAEEIENRLIGGVLFNTEQDLSVTQKALARANIGAGSENTGFQILGYYDTLEDLQQSLETPPQPGDAYGIGTEAPYEIYVWDGTSNTWLDNGTLNIGAVIDDGDISVTLTWSSNKIDRDMQAKITTTGMLKGAGSGSIVAAVKGTDYGALSFAITLDADDWENNTQGILDSRFLASGYAYTVTPASTSFTDYGICGIYADDITYDNLLTFHCSVIPESDLTVNIMRVVSA